MRFLCLLMLASAVGCTTNTSFKSSQNSQKLNNSSESKLKIYKDTVSTKTTTITNQDGSITTHTSLKINEVKELKTGKEVIGTKHVNIDTNTKTTNMVWDTINKKWINVK